MSNMDVSTDSKHEESGEESACGGDNNENLGECSKVNLEPLSHGYSADEDEKFQALRESVLPHSEEGSKRKLNRELFPAQDLKVPKLAAEQDKGVLVAYGNVPKPLAQLTISQICESNLRFAFEGKVLNVYGTYKSSHEFKKYLKTDLTDKEGHSTITLVISEAFIPKFLNLILPGTFIRIEGGVVKARKIHDGGTSNFSLHVDATTFIIKAEPFVVALVFVPEISIQKLLLKAQKNPSVKGTIAFVVIQIDKVNKSEGGTFEQLTIADGPSPMDRATLTFVSQRKSVYHDLVEQFQRGNIVMCVGRNVGVWKGKSNTLSVFDLTLLTPVYGERRKQDLESAFRVQISEMGYGKEVFGTLQITNVNDVLIGKKCASCKSTKVNTLEEGGFCFGCGFVVDILEVPSLAGILTAPSGETTEVSLEGDAVDRVLKLEKRFVQIYNESVFSARLLLSDVCKVGSFLLDNQGQVIAFNEASSSAT